MKFLVHKKFFSTPYKNVNSLSLNLNGIPMLLGQKRVIIVLIIVTIFLLLITDGPTPPIEIFLLLGSSNQEHPE